MNGPVTYWQMLLTLTHVQRGQERRRVESAMRNVDRTVANARLEGPGASPAHRLAEVVIAVALLLVAVPIVLVCAVGCAVTLRAWPFFVHERVGWRGRPFRMVKLRTLPTCTPVEASKYELAQINVPRFTEALRRSHLDELPQLALVVTGTMSLVGPRPEMASLHGALPTRFASDRTSGRPGCTGLWQISDRCGGLIGEAPEYDDFYAENRSARLDAWVLLMTGRMFLSGGRTVGLDDVPAWARRSERSLEVDYQSALVD